MHNRPTIKTILQDATTRLTAPLTLFVWVAACVIGAVAGPFGTLEDMPPGVRTGFWIVIVSGAVLTGYAARGLATLWIGPARPVLFDMVGIAVVTALLVPFILIVGGLVEARYQAPVPSVPRLTLYVLVIATPVFILRRLIPGFEAWRYGAGSEPAETPAQPRLMRRLPPEMRGGLIRLSANDHFTEVTTTEGTATLRLRLSDAIAETDPVRGHSTHRSHWVAEAAIREVRHETPHRIVVILHNDDKVPVSRKYRPELREAGLLD